MTEAEMNAFLDSRENDRIEADLERLFGPLGPTTRFYGENDEVVAWTILGHVEIDRNLVPVCGTTEEEGEGARDQRAGILALVRAAYLAGRDHRPGEGRDFEAAVDAAVDVMDAGTHTAADVVHAAIGAYLGKPATPPHPVPGHEEGDPARKAEANGPSADTACEATLAHGRAM